MDAKLQRSTYVYGRLNKGPANVLRGIILYLVTKRSLKFCFFLFQTTPFSLLPFLSLVGALSQISRVCSLVDQFPQTVKSKLWLATSTSLVHKSSIQLKRNFSWIACLRTHFLCCGRPKPFQPRPFHLWHAARPGSVRWFASNAAAVTTGRWKKIPWNEVPPQSKHGYYLQKSRISLADWTTTPTRYANGLQDTRISRVGVFGSISSGVCHACILRGPDDYGLMDTKTSTCMSFSQYPKLGLRIIQDVDLT